MGTIIVGAGMAGLLAGKLTNDSSIVERQGSLPNNHSAVMRFGSDKISKALDIPFKEVDMIKCISPYRNEVADQLLYAKKVSGTWRSDRSVGRGGNGKRFISPDNLIAQMAEGQDIHFNYDFNLDFAVANQSSEDLTISTIPMPELMGILDYNKGPDFESIEGINIKAKIPNCVAYATIYVPDPDTPISRISITGNELIIEICDCSETWDLASKIKRNAIAYIGDACDDRQINKYVSSALSEFGINIKNPLNPVAYIQKYAKIVPIDEEARKDFIFWATDKYGIYSLGRYATWQPSLMLDSLIDDIQRIKAYHGSRSRSYNLTKTRQKGKES